jgi:hypothetical protein
MPPKPLISQAGNYLTEPGEFVPFDENDFFANAFFIDGGGPGFSGHETGFCG